MPLPLICATALALAMDAFAVSLSAGIFLGSLRIRQMFRLAWHFGLFQALMPVIGWSCGMTIRQAIAAWDHWVACGLLALVGGHMLRAGIGGHPADRPPRDPTRGWPLVFLSVATSIDALAVGLSLAVTGSPILLPATIIGIVAFCCTAGGIFLGTRLRQITRLSAGAEILGGCILIGIGIAILHAHGAI